MPLLSALAASPYADLARLAVTAAGDDNDPLHTNAVELVRRPIDVGTTVLRPGQVIVCFRQINTIAAIDPDEGRVETPPAGLVGWHRGGSFGSNWLGVRFEPRGAARSGSPQNTIGLRVARAVTPVVTP